LNETEQHIWDLQQKNSTAGHGADHAAEKE